MGWGGQWWTKHRSILAGSRGFLQLMTAGCPPERTDKNAPFSFTRPPCTSPQQTHWVRTVCLSAREQSFF